MACAKDDRHDTGAVHLQGKELAAPPNWTVTDDLLGIVHRHLTHTLNEDDEGP